MVDTAPAVAENGRNGFDAFNTAGGGKPALWDGESGHHVEIIGLGDAAILALHWHEGVERGTLSGVLAASVLLRRGPGR